MIRVHCLAASMVSLVSVLHAGGADRLPKVTPGPPRSLDYKFLPSDAELHHRTKWSGNLFIYIDDDAAAPSIYTFDRSGRSVFSAMIQLPDVSDMRVQDFAAAPDDSVWAGGNAESRSGQQSFFLAHISQDGANVQIIQTNPYEPRQIAVAPDGSVWTVGYEVLPGDGGRLGKIDETRDALRHFDPSGRLMKSGVPVSSVGPLRASRGYLAAIGDRVGWYSPTHGSGAYLELSSNMKVLATFPLPANIDRRSHTWGFALTPSGNASVVISHVNQDGTGTAVLYQLDRDSAHWVAVEMPRDPDNSIPMWMLEGNDGESLIFNGPPDKSKLHVFNLLQ